MRGGTIADRERFLRRCRQRRRAAICATVAAITLPVNLAFAGETWDGGSASDNWSSAENWNPNGAPANDGTANVTFAGSVRTAPILDTSFSVASLTFNSPAA